MGGKERENDLKIVRETINMDLVNVNDRDENDIDGSESAYVHQVSSPTICWTQ